MEDKLIYIVKSDGSREPFSVAKLEESLLHSGASKKSITEVISHVSSELMDGMTTREIYKHAFEILKREEKPVALKYSLRHAIMELGPSGFPFEDFIAEIFRAKGFEAITGQMVKGFCTTHEVDVVAWDDKKLIMVEAKFHNEFGMKSDLKTILYVKARFDDLGKMKFNYGGRERELDEGWLVTNTKFSSTAIEYGSCQGSVKMVGWNYPPAGNLHDMILDAKLHPLTCLTGLNGREKRELLSKGVVLCKSILDNPELLDSVSVDKDRIPEVMDEIRSL